jgi:3-hydroxybutyryl-CoA dehydrogenase
MFKFSPYERYMMPAHFGPVPQNEKSSGWYRDVTVMVVPYLTDREKLAAHLPHPFTVGEQPVITVAYACSKDVDWLAGRGYNLFSVTASAVFNGENEQLEGQYSLVWWENLADAIISGRELTGIPKIFGDIPDHTITDGRWQSSVSHFDNRILDMSIDGLRVPTPEEIEAAQKASLEGRDHPMAWRYLPRVGGFGATVSEPTTFPSESVYTGLWIGEGIIEWNHLSWEQNPTQCHIVNGLADLPVLEYLPAMVTTGSSNLFVPDRMPRVLDKKQTLPASATEEAALNPIDEIKTVCFVGAGTMGCVNSLVAAISGYNVELYDISEDTLKQVPQRYKEFGPFLVGGGYCTAAALGAAFERISVGSDLEKATADADLVSESVFESLELKREIHQKLDEVCPDKTILTTNTSSLLVSDIEDVVARGDRFAAVHSYMGSRLVDIVAGPRTTAQTIDILNRYVESLSLVPLVLKKENPGYVMNSLIFALLATAMALVVEGIADKEEIDRAYMAHFKAPMGPFGIMDMIGLDLVFSEERPDQPANQLNQSPDSERLEKLLSKNRGHFQSYIERGEFGTKTGKGFYTYPAPAYAQADFLTGTGDDSVIFHALVRALVRSAAVVALRDVAEPADIDRTWTIGTGLEKGPFEILNEIGIDEFFDISEQLPEQLDLVSAEDKKLVEAYIKRL